MVKCTGCGEVTGEVRVEDQESIVVMVRFMTESTMSVLSRLFFTCAWTERDS